MLDFISQIRYIGAIANTSYFDGGRFDHVSGNFGND